VVEHVEQVLRQVPRQVVSVSRHLLRHEVLPPQEPSHAVRSARHLSAQVLAGSVHDAGALVQAASVVVSARVSATPSPIASDAPASIVCSPSKS